MGCCYSKSEDDVAYTANAGAAAPPSSLVGSPVHSPVGGPVGEPVPVSPDAHVASDVPGPSGSRMTSNKNVESLVLQMLKVIAAFVDNDEESPASLVKLHVIADKEEGWIDVVLSVIRVIPIDDPFGPSAITILLDDCPLPSKDTVIKMTKLLNLSTERANAENVNIQAERNICVVLGCIAEKLAGPNSVAILTPNVLDYLMAFLNNRKEARVVLFALIALEKFAHSTENKLSIKSRHEKEKYNSLLELENLASDTDHWWRQVGFCAKWAMDNMFIVEGRPLSYETEDMTGKNVILNSHDVSEYLKISSDGLEARCDSYSFESVRGTLQVDEGCWYYEATIISPGVMQIGWATKNSHFLNHEGYGIGDDNFSLSYDGCRRLIWHKAKPSKCQDLPSWTVGDVLGCFIDLSNKEIVFSLNGVSLPPCKDIFETSRRGFFAAASFMAFQQCRFNFGFEPYQFPPADKTFSSFNDYGLLTEEEKQVIPRRLFLDQLRLSSVKDDCCTLCFDETATCKLEPCGHKGFCCVCTSLLKECPMCRAHITNIRQEVL